MRRVIIIIGIIGSSIGLSIDTASSKHSGGSTAFHHNHFNLPKRVVFSLNDRYRNFDMIHTQRVFHRGRVAYNFLMRRRNSFLDVTIKENGRIVSERRINRFPVRNDYCNSLGGFQPSDAYRYRKPNRHRKHQNPYKYGYRQNPTYGSNQYSDRHDNYQYRHGERGRQPKDDRNIRWENYQEHYYDDGSSRKYSKSNRRRG